jgi:rare lipoprotein A
MAGTSIRHLALLVAVAVTLSACENMPNPFAAKENSAEQPITTEAAKSVRLVDRDVEAPEVFQVTDTALWDGRPSLGGVWVASPDVVNPERVILRNEANGKFVIGALFRRERDNPGPKLQISSDAADALGMLAGQPGQLNVTALRREDTKSEAVATATPAQTVANADPEGEETAAVDPIAAASAAIDKADGGQTGDATQPIEGAAADGTDLAAATAAATVAAPTDDLDPTPRPGETKRQARKRVRAAQKAAAAAAAAGPAITDDAALAPATAAPPALEVAPLPDVGATPAPAAASSGSTRIQIGIFSVEANAKRAADTLNSGGVTAAVREETSNGKKFWSVVASGDGDRAALLAKVKGLGFVDAYVVSN